MSNPAILTVEKIYALPVDGYGWRVLPNGNHVTLGNGVTLGNHVTLGNGVTLGDDGKDFKRSPLQIQGSYHLLYVAGPTIIGIGCIRATGAWWLEHYEAVGRKEHYEPQHIAEYRHWLDIAIAWQATLPKAVVTT